MSFPVRRDGLREQVVAALLDEHGPRSWRGLHPYAKWTGAFWRLTTLVDLDADPADPRIAGMAEAVLDWLISPGRRARVERARVNGRVRWCASQDGLGLWAAARLGLAKDPRARLLAHSLTSWQWPDGGWNCDKRPAATHSSFHETHGPLRGLVAYDEAVGDRAARTAAQRAAGFLLAHRLYRSCRTGEVVNRQFVDLHWPSYWHYDVLVGLRGLAAADALGHPDAAEALDLLEAARRPDGSWRTRGRRYWRPPGSGGSNVESADLSAVAPVVVTAQASDLLQQAGRDVPAADDRPSGA